MKSISLPVTRDIMIMAKLEAEIMEETMVFGLTSGNAAMMLLKLLETAMTPIIRIAHM